MSYIGLAKPIIAKLINEEEARYTDAFICGKAIGVEITRQYAEGSLQADNIMADYDKEFKNAEVTLNTSTLPMQAHKLMFGHLVTEDESSQSVTYRAEDESEFVGTGFYVTEKIDGKRKYTAMWLYKTKYTEGAESYSTKGDNIEYQTPSVSGQAMALPDGRWKEVRTFDTMTEAISWLNVMSGRMVTIPASSKILYDMSIADMIEPGMEVGSDGKVTGTFKHLTGYTGFSSKAEEQEGYYFPFRLEKKGEKMSFYKNGAPAKKDIPWDEYNVFRVTQGDTFEIRVDNISVIRLTFADAVFQAKK
ncbi:major tail protein [Diplocloster hominis]|uniref:major tail protein n=1 Tax=Diplocloster hominis TaxID=3079010 RepID=UPI0031BA40CF